MDFKSLRLAERSSGSFPGRIVNPHIQSYPIKLRGRALNVEGTEFPIMIQE